MADTPNIVDYAQTAFETFDERPLCAVDSLVFAWLAYLHIPAELHDAYGWQGMRLAELFRAEHFPTYFEGVWDPESTQRLLAAVCASPRFRDVRVCGFVEQLDVEAEKQFAAVTFVLPTGVAHASFRGTDSTVVGWKEDFNLAFMNPAASQEAARDYVCELARHVDGPLVTGGHSKGGNLAVYAAIKAARQVQERIVQTYSHDGPGFRAEVLAGDDYRAIAARIKKTVPQSSVVGLLLEQHETYRIVKSTQKSFLQHDPFSWEVKDGDFVDYDQLTIDARYYDLALNGWIRQLSDADRERLSDSLYDMLVANDIQNVSDITADWQKNIPALARTYAQMDPDTRDFLGRVIGELARLGARSVPEAIKDELAARGIGEPRSASAPAGAAAPSAPAPAAP